ncbi:hypothetical protein D3C87_1638130 [compost metagenome]
MFDAPLFLIDDFLVCFSGQRSFVGDNAPFEAKPPIRILWKISILGYNFNFGFPPIVFSFRDKRFRIIVEGHITGFV